MGLPIRQTSKTILLLTTVLGCTANEFEPTSPSLPSASPCRFENQPKNVTVLQGHNATLTFSTQGCEFVSGTEVFINSATTDIVHNSEFLVTDGGQQGEKQYEITLAEVTEPVAVWFEAFKTLVPQSKSIRSQTAFVFVQGCPGPVSNASFVFTTNHTFQLSFTPPESAEQFSTHYDISVISNDSLQTVVFNETINTKHTWVTVDSPLWSISYICRITPVNDVGPSTNFTDLTVIFPGYVPMQDLDCSNVEMSGEHQACVNLSGIVCDKECLNCTPTFLKVDGDKSGTPFSDCVDKFDVSTYELENGCTKLVYRYCMKVGFHFNVTFLLGNLVGSSSFGPRLIPSHHVQEVSIGRPNKQSPFVCFICTFAMNSTVSGCQFKFNPPLSNGRNMSYVSREDDKAADCFELPEEIADLTVEVYDFFLGNESSEPAYVNSSVSVPARDEATGPSDDPTGGSTGSPTAGDDDSNKGSIIITCIVGLFALACFIGIVLLIFLVHGYLKNGQAPAGGHQQSSQKPPSDASCDGKCGGPKVVAEVVMEDVKIENTDPTCSSITYNTANEPPTEPPTFSELISNSAEDDLNLDIAYPPHQPTPHLQRAETPEYPLAEVGIDTGGGASMLTVPSST